MFWGAFGFNGKTDLAVVPTKCDSIGYQNVLKSHLLSQGQKVGGRGWIFQQDNAPIHSSRSTKDFLASKNVRLLPWPARSPDLNPIENLWGELARRVYTHGKQYSSVTELQESVIREWNNIPLDVLQNLINSMNNRIFEVILKSGGHTHY